MDTITSLTRRVLLSSNDLFSKWGFSDGDLLRLPLDEYDGPRAQPADAENTFDKRVLIRLIRERLLPLCPAGTDVYEIGSIHNPIRVEDDVARFPEVEVWVSWSDVLRVAAEVDSV